VCVINKVKLKKCSYNNFKLWQIVQLILKETGIAEQKLSDGHKILLDSMVKGGGATEKGKCKSEVTSKAPGQVSTAGRGVSGRGGGRGGGRSGGRGEASGSAGPGRGSGDKCFSCGTTDDPHSWKVNVCGQNRKFSSRILPGVTFTPTDIA